MKLKEKTKEEKSNKMKHKYHTVRSVKPISEIYLKLVSSTLQYGTVSFV
jgi:hypothetical protein